MVDSEVIYGSDWMNLRVGKAYLVIVDEENTHYEDTWDLAGNVMVFQKYEKLDAKTIAARQSTVDVLLDSLKQLRDSYDSDDSTYTEGGDEDTLYQLGQARRMIKKYCHMENYQFHFWDVRNKTMHIIDPCAERRGRIEILDLASSGWAQCEDGYIINPHWQKFPTNHVRGRETMNKLRRLTAQYVWQEVAAMRIQRGWRKANADPKHTLCKKRLRREFEEYEEAAAVIRQSP